MSDMNTIYLKDYKECGFEVESCELCFELFEEFVVVTNIMKIKKKDAQEKHIELDSMDLDLLEIYLNDLRLNDSRYDIKEESFTVFNVPNSFSLKIQNRLYPQNNSELEGLYKSGSIFCTQNEPEGFRRITPYLDRPDIMSVFTTTIVADKEKYPVLLGNGNKQSSHDLADARHEVTWFDPHPKPSYLFAIVAGDLGLISDEFTTASKEKVELNIYCDKGAESKCFFAMKSLKDAMIWDEQKYGREYDLDVYNIVAVDSFNMGAMENKGLNIFNSHYVLADEDKATDADFMGIQSVIAHEYFHNWTGNRITCRDWFELTLKEGLTVFRDQCFSADLNSQEVQRIEDVKGLRERQFVEDASPMAHPIQPDSYISINNFYTSTVYEKGAEVIRMIHTLLGEKKFREAMDLYFESFDGQAVRTDDFLWAMSEVDKDGRVDFAQFKRWYHQSGTPSLEVKESFNDGVYKLDLKQVIPNKVDGTKQEPFYFPLKIGLIGSHAQEIKEETLIVSKEVQEFVFDGFSEKPYLSINRAFSAPIIIKQEKNEYAFLMKHDKDSFVRYESAQSFATVTIEKLMESAELDTEFLNSFGYILDLDVELSYKALLLDLPSISSLMQRQKVVDFAPIYLACERLEREVATEYKEKLLDLYKLYHKPKNRDLDAISVGERALKNRALRILSSLESKEIIDLAYKQYQESSTMSDRIVALDVLENITSHEGELALGDFYARYKEDTLVMNKYFSIISASQREGTLLRVIASQDDEVYDKKVPNLVRSLVGVFARNYKYFHSNDGSGYSFVADKILEIDKINAQMASGLASAFKIYDRLNSHSKSLMRQELLRVLDTPNLSKNTYEIVSKILK
ncbi:MAG: aminopeptidase N [Sulfurimonas sp.]|uniref:aminopeptidase N n=1 Tax=Sulfurimonas sp. TaxID=2022749 RepID=UPI0025D86861|nr:aminopeptidase N [Sulfurimonas sp.]MCK9492116.1 aminopeptidase N [Sulfurimonas sp.]